jgi:flagellar hook protein FlgE
VAARSNLITTIPLFDSPGSFFQLDLTKLTQYGSTSGVSYVSQDGYSAGQFSNLNVDQTGLVQGIYTNGRTLNLGQIQLTSFLNPHGLQPLGDNQWAETGTSGKQNSDAPGNGLLGYLQSGSVEESNVDLTSELVNLIVAQRMYQANAQTISAQSTVLQTLVNLR